MHLNWHKLCETLGANADPMLWGQPIMLLQALDPAWTLTLALSGMYLVSCRVLYVSIPMEQIPQRPHWGEAWAPYTVQHHRQVRHGL